MYCLGYHLPLLQHCRWRSVNDIGKCALSAIKSQIGMRETMTRWKEGD